MSTPAHVPSLPQEIIDLILDYVFVLGHDSTTDISTCALICRAFRPRCQMHLFRKVELTSSETRNRVERINDFQTILHCSNNIALYVQAIRLTIWSHDSAWLACYSALAALLSQIIELGGCPQELEIEGSDPFIPQAFPERAALNESASYPFQLITPSITSIRLSAVSNVPPALLSGCPNLTRLRLVCTDVNTLDDHSVLEVDPARSKPQIESLEFDRPTGTMRVVLDTFEKTTAIVDLSRLKVLRSTINRQNIRYIEKIVNASANHLEEIHLRSSSMYGEFYYEDWDEIPFHFDFEHILNLRILSLAVAVDRTLELGTTEEIFENICGVIKSIPRTGVFETLNLHAELELTDMVTFIEEFESSWHLLEFSIVALASKRRLSLNVYLEVSPTFHDDRDGSEAEPPLPDFQAQLTKRLAIAATSPNIILKVYTSRLGSDAGEA
ncbi:hypothetical protein CVT26_006229 [Gymnopilus dilepis]|uniref:F-box domain-containing protein n=1 Tax=Gymnopilus dilepis TaxID=231916 RepID=A0A409Y187_9AGAR|nr:hypothetical protein CVT26_006229 [Gymnopilus dilepis]